MKVANFDFNVDFFYFQASKKANFFHNFLGHKKGKTKLCSKKLYFKGVLVKIFRFFKKQLKIGQFYNIIRIIFIQQDPSQGSQSIFLCCRTHRRYRKSAGIIAALDFRTFGSLLYRTQSASAKPPMQECRQRHRQEIMGGQLIQGIGWKGRSKQPR